MKKPIVTMLAVLTVSCAVFGGCKKDNPEKADVPQTTPALSHTAPTSKEQTKTGEALFKQNCAVCHPNGGNTDNAKKTLHGSDLSSNNISKPSDIVRIMRNPGPGMTKFDNATVSDTDATAIAEYILKAFK